MNALATAGPTADLPALAAKRGIAEATWNTLTNALYPGADPASVLMVWDYCQARSLDPLKKPVHIVPMNVKDAKTGRYEWRDVVMPGVYEHRITAQRTNEYLGHSAPEYGPMVKYREVEAPEWCSMVFYHHSPAAGKAIEFPVKVYFSEACGLDKEGNVNQTWRKRPRGMLTKCTEAAGLREAFPEELGGEPTIEEMTDQTISVSAVLEQPNAPEEPKPDGYERWVLDLESVADEGTERLQKVWKDSAADLRAYLTRHSMSRWDDIKAKAGRVPVL